MEIWLGQDPLQIVGSFVVQLSNYQPIFLRQCMGVLNSRKVFGSLHRTFSGMVSVTCFVWQGNEYENIANDFSKICLVSYP